MKKGRPGQVGPDLRRSAKPETDPDVITAFNYAILLILIIYLILAIMIHLSNYALNITID